MQTGKPASIASIAMRMCVSHDVKTQIASRSLRASTSSYRSVPFGARCFG